MTGERRNQPPHAMHRLTVRDKQRAPSVAVARALDTRQRAGRRRRRISDLSTWGWVFPPSVTGCPLRASRKQRSDPRADLRTARKKLLVFRPSQARALSQFLQGYFVRKPWSGVERRGKQRKQWRRTVALFYLQLPVLFTPVLLMFELVLAANMFLTQVNLQQQLTSSAQQLKLYSLRFKI